MSPWKIIKGIDLYFITTTIVEWEYVFTSIPYFEIILGSMGYCVEKKGLKVHAYVIMPNHAHYIFSAPGGLLSDVVRDFNTHTSRVITAELMREGKIGTINVFRNAAKLDGRDNQFKVWQEGYHPVALDSDYICQQRLNYLHQNPVKKGFVEEPEYWKYSSARNYRLNDHSLFKVECLY
ncbi:MAG: transposase [Bacteroidota bacterium]